LLFVCVWTSLVIHGLLANPCVSYFAVLSALLLNEKRVKSRSRKKSSEAGWGLILLQLSSDDQSCLSRSRIYAASNGHGWMDNGFIQTPNHHIVSCVLALTYVPAEILT
jgi:DNA-binding transcriptional regulator PaaX